jgi:hypothetical protein
MKEKCFAFIYKNVSDFITSNKWLWSQFITKKSNHEVIFLAVEGQEKIIFISSQKIFEKYNYIQANLNILCHEIYIYYNKIGFDFCR